MKLTIETVRRQKTVSGELVQRKVAATVDDAPFRLGKRAGFAHKVGLQFIKALGDSAAIDTPYVAVVDGQRRILAAWCAMDGLPGYTGTLDKHPLISGRGAFWKAAISNTY